MMTTPERPSQEASEAWQDVKAIRGNLQFQDGPLRVTSRIEGTFYVAFDVMKARAADAQQIAALNARNQELEEVQEITAQETERLFTENTALREHTAGDEPTNDEYVVRLEGELEAIREITEPWQAVHHLDPHQCLFGRFHPVEEVEKARQAERAQHQAALAEARQQIAALRWTLDNVFTIARRELRQLERIADREREQERWGHILRLCEKAGCSSRGVLRDNGGEV